ncbi:hypothetical protein [Inquilinus ginsengisoli]|uniref:hypothetical protein n=1 Tax=Inquilinus ginsengisoli TaxID=363840 RepID=UPI003D1E84F6
MIPDHAMPRMTGAELADPIAAEWPGLPVILATGYAELPMGVGRTCRSSPNPSRWRSWRWRSGPYLRQGRGGQSVNPRGVPTPVGTASAGFRATLRSHDLEPIHTRRWAPGGSVVRPGPGILQLGDRSPATPR